MEAQEGRRSGWALAGLAALLAAGAAARLHGQERSLWLDEAWVANSVLAPGVGEMLRYEAWLQTSPPLFLLLVRATVALVGESNAAFRAIPALFSLASLALITVLAWRWLRPPSALLAIALFALSPQAAQAGASLKPYASDAFASLALLALGAAYLTAPSGRRLAAALLAAATLAPLSFSAPLFLPALLLASLGRRETRAPPGHALAIAATGAVAALGLYMLCVLPNREPSLLEYFRSGFFPGGGAADLALWIAARLRVLAGFGPAIARAAPGAIAVAGLAVLGIAAWLCRGVAGDRPVLARGAVLGTPIAATLVLNLAGLFPIASGNDRVLAFLQPVVALAAGAGVEALALGAARLAPRGGAPASLRRGDAPAWVAFATLLVAIGLAAPAGALRALTTRPAEEEVEAAVAHLAREVAAADLLYVHDTMREGFAFYARRTPPRAGRTLLGEVDGPCCPRGRTWRRDEDPAASMPAEIARIAAAGAPGRRLWALVTDRESHFRQRGRRSPALLERGLAAIGCRRDATTAFRGVRVERYACAPAPADIIGSEESR